jgi:hypothetical protein
MEDEMEKAEADLAVTRARGRPAHEPTPQLRRRVSIAAAGGMSQEAIAIALNISAPTLRKAYRAELSTGMQSLRMDLLEAVYARAEKGDTAAAARFLGRQWAPRAASEGLKAARDRLAKVAQQDTPWAALLPGVQ